MTIRCLFLCAALALAACGATVTQQPAPTATALQQRSDKTFGDLLTEEDRDERRADNCRSNGESTADDAEDCKINDE